MSGCEDEKSSSNEEQEVSEKSETGHHDVSDVPEHDQVNILANEKKRLEKVLQEKKDQLNKLNLVKLYRSKNDLADLDSLILKWREASQEAVEELYETVVTNKEVSMGEFLHSMNIDVNLIKYDEDAETFVT